MAHEQPPFAAGFMDDYFAEADDHVITAKRALLTLEATLGGAAPPAVLEELFRCFHSLKGISAMVDLREAETLAHEMESVLRLLQEGRTVLHASHVETLFDGTKAVEDVITAQRTGAPVPDIGPSLRALEALSPRSAGPHDSIGSSGSSTEPVRTPTAPVPVWKVTFVPSPDLVARGVKVDTIRARLLELGRVLTVTPTVHAGGGISFEFRLQTAQEDGLASLSSDGVTYEPWPASAPATDAGIESTTTVPSALHRSWDTVPHGLASYVRVDLVRLDELMRLVGDLVVTRARFDDTLQRVERAIPAADSRALQEHNGLMERQLRDLREGIMRVRLVPVGEIFKRMPFAVRDLARDTAKRVRLELAGQTTEIDKFLIERMMDPVLHLVRNAISHGIETPDRRTAVGKSAEGVIRLGASTAGESVILEVSDDGAGIDTEAVVARAREVGLTLADGAPGSRAILDVICASGFSTRQEADRASGRGVGMAVVRQTIQELGGSLSVETQSGKGTTFSITLPLTLAITDAILAHVGDRVFAVPQAAVREVIEVDAGAVRAMEHNELIPYRTGTLPVARLADIFQLPTTPRARFHAIVVGTGLSSVGLIVDRVAGQREVVVKTITDPLIRVEGISGATELGDGRLVLIVDAAALSRRLRSRRAHRGIHKAAV